jgi:hypothetical protein
LRSGGNCSGRATGASVGATADAAAGKSAGVITGMFEDGFFLSLSIIAYMPLDEQKNKATRHFAGKHLSIKNLIWTGHPPWPTIPIKKAA